VLVTDDTFNVMLGGGLGFGSVKWDGDETLPGGDNESLKMSYYPLKVRLAAQFLDKTRAYGAGIFLQDAVPARTTYTDLDGTYQDTVGGIGNFALNFMVGAEVGVQFGDFTPPKKGKKGKKGKDGGGGKAGGGKDGGARDGGGGGGGGGGGKKKGGGGGGGGKDGPGAHP
jgi:hypothetical protein